MATQTFALIVPAGTAAASLAQIFLFVMLFAIVPGSLGATILRYAGFTQRGSTRSFSPKQFAQKIFEITLYHAAMLAVWMISWPQIYNDIHTGYSLSGMIPFAGLMILWTLLGIYYIYTYRYLIGRQSYRPRIGMFIRLYLWNFALMLFLRQIIFYFVTSTQAYGIQRTICHNRKLQRCTERTF